MSDFASPPQAAAVFGPRLPLAERFVELLGDSGIRHGLLGPRERPRLWDRHVLNCAVVAMLLPPAPSPQRLIDVGSGAGLPGLALAIARPDLEVHLVEPLSRRTAWLRDVVESLSLESVTVHTARAESLWGRLDAPWVTARAVTGVVQLARWTFPLLTGGGTLLALKGSRASDELTEHRGVLERLGAVRMAVTQAGTDLLTEPTTVLSLGIEQPVDLRRWRRLPPSSAGSARRRADRRGSTGEGTGRTRSGDDPVR